MHILFAREILMRVVSFCGRGGPKLGVCGPLKSPEANEVPRPLNALKMTLKKLLLVCYDYFFSFTS